jgi:phosphoribosyl-AMP cyclohydrolase
MLKSHVLKNPGQEGAIVNQLEEGKTLRLDFAKIAKIAAKCQDVIPVAVQNADTKAVILVAYVNEQALKKAVATRTAVFWSTSRNELWEKGKTSGEVFDLLDIYVNCEQNSLLYMVRPRRGGICHTKSRSDESRSTCYYRKLNRDTWELENIEP